MPYSKEVLEFFGKNKVFYSTFLHNIDQKKVLSKYISIKLNKNKGKNWNKALCIGGGSGEGDLGIIKKVKIKNLTIDYIDPSEEMSRLFIKNARKMKLDKNIREVHVKKFEETDIEPDSYDIILAINSIYFIDWKNKKDSPLKKIYDSLKENGLAVIAVRSGESDHSYLKKLAGGGRTTGEVIREELRKHDISHYVETIDSKINVKDLFKGEKFSPNENGKRLLAFIFGNRWKTLPNAKKEEIISELKKRTVKIHGQPMLKAKHEYIWIYKESKNCPDATPLTDASEKKLAEKIRKAVNNVPDFPIKGILFRDTTPIMRNGKLFSEIIDHVKEKYKGRKIDYVVAKDMQGLIWAGAIAKSLGCGVIPMFRKDMAGDVLTATYEHEYNPNRVVNLQKKAIKKGDKILIVDYIIATGETMRVMAKLIEHLGGKVEGIFSMIELTKLKPRKGLEKYDVHTLVRY